MAAAYVRRFDKTYVPNKTISLPDEVIPIIESLGEPFSNWVRDQLLKQRGRQEDGAPRWEQIEAMMVEINYPPAA